MSSRKHSNLLLFSSLLLVVALLATLLVSAPHSSQAQPASTVIITGIVDGPLSGGLPKAIELYVVGTVDLSGYTLQRSSNGNAFGSDAALSGTYTDEFVYLSSNTTNFGTVFGTSGDFANLLSVGIVNGNGNDGFRILQGSTVIDQVYEENNANIYADSYMYRNNGTGPDAGWVIGNWTIPGNDTLDSATDEAAVAAAVPFGTYTVGSGATATPTATTDPAATATPTATATSGPTCGGSATLISAVQGNGNASPLDGQTVTVEGVLVGEYPGNSIRGFYVQEEDSDADADAETSEGIFVFVSDTDYGVNEGDVVRVTGTVSEFQNQTQITPSSVTVCSSNNPVTPASIDLPVPAAVGGVEHLERFEGMLVEFVDDLYVTEYFQYDRFGEILLSSNERLYQPTQLETPGVDSDAVLDENNRNKILFDDSSNVQNEDLLIFPPPQFSLTNFFRGGDRLTNGAGVLAYSWGGNGASPNAYRVRPSSLVPTLNFVQDNPRPAMPADVGGDVKVASFNVLNYFNGDGAGGGFPTARGADNAAELVRQTQKITSAILAIDADVVGLVELENDYDQILTEVSSIEQLVDELNDSAGAGTYDFINPGGNVGTDEIAVGIIYKPGTVSPVGTSAVLDTNDFIDPNNIGSPKNRAALAQTFQYDATGDTFTVVVNHFKSKGSSCGAGDDDTRQGNCNGTRTGAAQELAAWLDTDPTSSNDPDVLILGDLNAYAKEDPIVALQDEGYTDLIAQFLGEKAYSFVFSGQFGYLDYAMASTSMVTQVVGVTEWHINADESDLFDYNDAAGSFKTAYQETLFEVNAFRSSDHDPVIVGLNFGGSARIGTDYNGDGQQDIFWRKPSNGSNVLWLMNANSRISSNAIQSLSDGWQVHGAADFDGSGTDDIFWYKPSNGSLAVWLLQGDATSVSRQDIVRPAPLAAVGGTQWTFGGLGDVNADGRVDVIWRGGTSGVLVGVSLGTGSGSNVGFAPLTLLPNVPATWQIVGVEDFTGDGKSDILFYTEQFGGYLYIWEMDGTTVANTFPVGGPGTTNWKVVGVADADNDGDPDIYWRSITTNSLYVWEMNGTAFDAAQFITRINRLEWRIPGVADYTDDGIADLLLRATDTGQNILWTYDGAGGVTASSINTVVPPTDWQIVGTDTTDYDGSGLIGPAALDDSTEPQIGQDYPLLQPDDTNGEVMNVAPPRVFEEMEVTQQQTVQIYLPYIFRR